MAELIKRLCPRSKGCPTKKLALEHGKILGLIGVHKAPKSEGYHPGNTHEEFNKAYFKDLRSMRKPIDPDVPKVKKLKQSTKDKLIDNSMEEPIDNLNVSEVIEIVKVADKVKKVKKVKKA